MSSQANRMSFCRLDLVDIEINSMSTLGGDAAAQRYTL
jgi:hypothetical protein